MHTKYLGKVLIKVGFLFQENGIAYLPGIYGQKISSDHTHPIGSQCKKWLVAGTETVCDGSKTGPGPDV